jgi:bifunctional DNA-binding transcriptional regulator/antitoxin component of YhaV-PrlF toxin-antitoxin module|tara:strand:- start:21623 stop:21808 length:186 start_codon:yes stop_codon:yes gene_type:complete
MLKIASLKIDDKGRITLPSSFLKANGIKAGSKVDVTSVYNSSCVKLEFNKCIDLSKDSSHI